MTYKQPKYKWKDSCGTSGLDANVVGEHLEKLEKETEGKLTSQAILESAAPKDSAIHDFFEWDDSVAAEAFRKAQSAALVDLRKLLFVHGVRFAALLGIGGGSVDFPYPK